MLWRKIATGLLLIVSVNVVQAQNLPNFSDIVEANSPAVVKINTVSHAQASPRSALPDSQQIPEIFRHFLDPRNQAERESRSLGSGFILSSDGYLLTNNHVVEGADEIVVRLQDRREFEAELVGTDKRSDLALLKIDAKGLPFLKFAKPDDLKVGEWVLAIGSPFGLDFSASAGIVSAIGRSIPTEDNENYVPFIQSDVAINPGNSGGPLFNLDGEVVGINSQIFTRSGGSIGLSFAIPASVAVNVVEQLKSKGRVDRGWLGVMIQEVDRDLAASFGLRKPEGALVARIEPGSPADDAGLQVGDIILKFAGEKIAESSDLPHVVGSTQPGESVPVEVIREGKKKSLSVTVATLGSQEDDQQAAGSDNSSDTGSSRLGMVVEALPKELAQRWDVKAGVLVTNVAPGSAADAAGLRPGDVVTQIGFNAISSLDDYTMVEQQLPSDSLLPIRFVRQGRPIFRTIATPK
ncbi:DegQ family serine endoprotease [Halioxenophilus sp. WMMB6]|uniref:DegQ family serine endoprotease n=1 Tax=Halioxenophilus sp. WMMB6 TaxID=3073815 RepID=UPI00295E5B14|nr:DegQ family serine endoprotease [Halioxenophilus sp. WMMB6]